MVDQWRVEELALVGRGSVWRTEVAVFAVALALRLGLVAHLPVMPFGDSYSRMSEPLTLVKATWLPGYQATLALVALVSEDPLWLRVITAIEGAGAAAAGAWCARVWLGPRAAPLVGVGVALLPSFVFPSINLYQEPLFLLCVFLGFGLARQRGPTHPATVLALGLACLTRYEAWPLALGVAVGSRSWRGVGFLAAPTAWVLYNGAISPAGTRSLHVEPSLARITERGAVVGQLLWDWGAGPLALVAAFVLLAALWRRPRPVLPLALGALVVLIVMALAVLDPYASVDNPRQLQLVLAVLLTLAAAGPGLLWPKRPALAWVVVALVAVPAALAFPAALSHQVDHNASRAVAAGQFLRATGWTTDLFVLGQGFPEYPDAPTVECEAIRAYTRGDVRCDFEGDPVLPDRTQTVVQIFALDPWRPLQREVLAAMRDPTRWQTAVVGPFAVWRRVDAAPGRTVDLPALLARLGEPVDCASLIDATLPPLSLEGAAVAVEPQRLAFYTNGLSRFIAPAAGHLLVRVCGTPAAGALPHFTATLGDTSRVWATFPSYTLLDLGAVEAGSPIEIRYDDDLVDEAGRDRNLFFASMALR